MPQNATAVATEVRTETKPAPAKRVSVPNTQMTAKDRCDATYQESALKPSTSCQVRAFVRVVLSNGQLVFCGHHYEQHKEAMGSKVLRVDDYREKRRFNRVTGQYSE